MQIDETTGRRPLARALDAWRAAKATWRAPATRYRNSRQIGISATGEIARDAWASPSARGVFTKGDGRKEVALPVGEALARTIQEMAEDGWSLAAVAGPTPKPLPVIFGRVIVWAGFEPRKAVLDEDLLVEFAGAGGAGWAAAHVEDAGDLLLVQAFVGSDNCLTCAPSQDSGISGAALSARALGNAVDWPTIRGRVEVCVGLAVKPTALFRVRPPEGCSTDDIVSVRVTATLNLFGPAA